MAYAAQCCRAWLFVHVTDRILKLAFDGSVKQAALTCEGLAGLEFREVADALMAASVAFESTVFDAIKGVLGKQWDTVGLDVKLEALKISYKNQQHRKAVETAYNFIALLNEKIAAMRSNAITSEEMLKNQFRVLFTDCSALLQHALEVTAVFSPVCQRRLAQNVRRSRKLTKICLPNGLVWEEVFFCTDKDDAEVLIYDGDGGKQIDSVAPNAWHTFNSAWGAAFTVVGNITDLKFDRAA